MQTILRLLCVVLAQVAAKDDGTSGADLGFCPQSSRSVLGYGPCRCSCSATKLCLSVRRTQCWPSVLITVNATSDPCTLSGQDGVHASLLGASAPLQPSVKHPLPSIRKFASTAPRLPVDLSVLRPPSGGESARRDTRSSETHGGTRSETGHGGGGAFVGSAEYTRLVSHLGRKVGAALDDPTQAVDVFATTGPGYQHVRVLREANLNQGLSWTELRARHSLPFARELHQLMSRYLLPHATYSLFSGTQPDVPRVVISRNVHVPHERYRSVAMLWHWDALADRSIKLLLYLTAVPNNRSGCMLAMLNRETHRAWRMGRRKLWGGDISPPSVPQPWMLELLGMGYEPTCLVGPAGTLIHFDTNIVHRGSRPEPGLQRDFILLELYPSTNATAITRGPLSTHAHEHLA